LNYVLRGFNFAPDWRAKLPLAFVTSYKNYQAMRKIAFLICIMISAAQQGKAEITSPFPDTSKAMEDVRFGFQTSPTFSWMQTDIGRVSSAGMNLGLKLGMMAEFYFRQNYAFSSGIGFMFNAGGTLLHEHPGIYWDPTILPAGIDTLPGMVKLKYGVQLVEIPFGLKMRTREFNHQRYYLEPQITLGIKTQARGTATGLGLGEEINKLNIKKEVNPINFSWGIHAGMEHNIDRNTSLVLGAGFQLGFMDMTRNRGSVFLPGQALPEREKSKGTIHGITIRLGILF
jgi:hypothetical protein